MAHSPNKANRCHVNLCSMKSDPSACGKFKLSPNHRSFTNLCEETTIPQVGSNSSPIGLAISKSSSTIGCRRKLGRKSASSRQKTLPKAEMSEGMEFIDIGIIYCGADGTDWAKFIADDLNRQLSSSSWPHMPKIQLLKVEDYRTNENGMIIQEKFFKSAVLQIAIISPQMLPLFGSLSEIRFDCLFNPKSVIALMLNVAPSEIYEDATLATVFNSFKEWVHMDVIRDNGEFVQSVRNQARKLLIGNDAYNRFSVTITQNKEVYIHLKIPTTKNSSMTVTVQRKQGDVNEDDSVNVMFRNPYTLSFSIPEKFLTLTTSLLSVCVSIDGERLGLKHFKCEGPMTALTTALEVGCDPIHIIAQALRISMQQGTLDKCLASVIKKVPLVKLLTHQDREVTDSMKESLCQTLLHSCANYGLPKFCSALLQDPWSERLSSCISYSDAPSVVIFKPIGIELDKLMDIYKAYEDVPKELNCLLQRKEIYGATNQMSALSFHNTSPPPIPRYTSAHDISFLTQNHDFNLHFSDANFRIPTPGGHCSCKNIHPGFSPQNEKGGYNYQIQENSLFPHGRNSPSLNLGQQDSSIGTNSGNIPDIGDNSPHQSLYEGAEELYAQAPPLPKKNRKVRTNVCRKISPNGKGGYTSQAVGGRAYTQNMQDGDVVYPGENLQSYNLDMQNSQHGKNSGHINGMGDFTPPPPMYDIEQVPKDIPKEFCHLEHNEMYTHTSQMSPLPSYNDDHPPVPSYPSAYDGSFAMQTPESRANLQFAEDNFRMLISGGNFSNKNIDGGICPQNGKCDYNFPAMDDNIFHTDKDNFIFSHRGSSKFHTDQKDFSFGADGDHITETDDSSPPEASYEDKDAIYILPPPVPRRK